MTAVWLKGIVHVNSVTLMRFPLLAILLSLLFTNAATGKYVTWDAKSPQISGGKLRIEKEPRPIIDSKTAKTKNPDYFVHQDNPDAVAIAVNADYVVASFPNLNKTAIFRPTGEELYDLTIDQQDLPTEAQFRLRSIPSLLQQASRINNLL